MLTHSDDIFAFLVEMPLKHKIMTLRDDVVFVLFLIQVYIYRVDKGRTNEFGYAYDEGPGDQLGHEKKEKQAWLIVERTHGACVYVSLWCSVDRIWH